MNSNKPLRIASSLNVFVLTFLLSLLGQVFWFEENELPGKLVVSLFTGIGVGIAFYIIFPKINHGATDPKQNKK